MSEEQPTEEMQHEQYDELQEIQQFLRVHGPRWLTGICIGLIIVAGVNLYRKNSQAKAVEASIQLSNATSSQDLEAVVQQYPKTATASIATLKLAKAHFSEGRYDRASELYNEFLKKHSDHMLAPVAEMGDHHCKEATGQLEVALKGFESFEKNHPDHFLSADAALGRGRCLQQLGRLEDARVVYENITADNPNKEASARAENWLKKVKRDMRAQSTSAPVIPEVSLSAPTTVTETEAEKTEEEAAEEEEKKEEEPADTPSDG